MSAQHGVDICKSEAACDTNITLEPCRRWVMNIAGVQHKTVKPKAKHTTELKQKKKKKTTSFSQPTSLTACWQSLSGPA